MSTHRAAALFLLQLAILLPLAPCATAQQSESEATAFQAARQRHEVYCEQQFSQRAAQLAPLRGKLPLREMGEPTPEMKAQPRRPTGPERAALRAYHAAYLACMRDLTRNVLHRPEPNASNSFGATDPAFEPLGMITLLRDGKITFGEFNTRLEKFWELTRSEPQAQARP